MCECVGVSELLFRDVGSGGDFIDPWYEQGEVLSAESVCTDAEDPQSARTIAVVSSSCEMVGGDVSSVSMSLDEPGIDCDGGVACWGKIPGKPDPRNGGVLKFNGPLPCNHAKPRKTPSPGYLRATKALQEALAARRHLSNS